MGSMELRNNHMEQSSTHTMNEQIEDEAMTQGEMQTILHFLKEDREANLAAHKEIWDVVRPLNDWHIRVGVGLWVIGVVLTGTFAVSLVILKAVIGG